MKKAMSLVLVLSLALTILVSVAPSQSPTSARLTTTQMVKTIGGTNLGCGLAVVYAFGGLAAIILGGPAGAVVAGLAYGAYGTAELGCLNVPL